MAATGSNFEGGPAAGAIVAIFARGRRDLCGLRPVLARAGALEARLATTKKEVRRAQRLRYRVFFEDGGAIPDPTARLIRRDICRFDRVCDHLLVYDRETPRRDGSPRLVGVYRLLRQDVAERHFGFYSAGEFDVGALLARQPAARFLELGRACIAPSHRGKRVLELLWRGLWAYARHHRIDAMFGCASLPGRDPAAHAGAIRLLSGDGDERSPWRIAAMPKLRAPGPSADPGVSDARAAARALPPLVKGYWRLGATFSREAVVDERFGTTDLFVVLPLAAVEARYLDYFGVEAVPPPLAA